MWCAILLPRQAILLAQAVEEILSMGKPGPFPLYTLSSREHAATAYRQTICFFNFCHGEHSTKCLTFFSTFSGQFLRHTLNARAHVQSAYKGLSDYVPAQYTQSFLWRVLHHPFWNYHARKYDRVGSCMGSRHASSTAKFGLSCATKRRVCSVWQPGERTSMPPNFTLLLLKSWTALTTKTPFLARFAC